MSEPILEKYRAYLKEVRLFSPRSVRDYGDGLRFFTEEMDPLAVKNRGEVRSSILKLKERKKWGEVTTCTKGKYLVSFFAWAHSEGLIPLNPWPFNEFKTPRRKEAPAVTEAIYRAMLLSSGLELRFRAAIMLLWDTGIRASELVSLDHEDLITNPGGYLIHVPREKSKGKFSDRYIPVTMATAGVLMAQIDISRAKGDKAIFLSKSGARLHSPDLWAAVSGAGQRAGYNGVNPKMFRHAFGMRMLRAGAPQLVVMGWMGHSSIQMTNHYLHQTPEDSLHFYPKMA